MLLCLQLCDDKVIICYCEHNFQKLFLELVGSENPRVVSQLIELAHKQLQSHTPTSPPPVTPSTRPVSGSDEITISELLGLAVAMFSLAGGRCVHNDGEIRTLTVSGG